jgi:hypothetical protein
MAGRGSSVSEKILLHANNRKIRTIRGQIRLNNWVAQLVEIGIPLLATENYRRGKGQNPETFHFFLIQTVEIADVTVE